jgi:hypothetical protein
LHHDEQLRALFADISKDKLEMLHTTGILYRS